MTPFRHESIFSVSKVLSLALLTAVGCRIRKGDKRTSALAGQLDSYRVQLTSPFFFSLCQKAFCFHFRLTPKICLFIFVLARRSNSHFLIFHLVFQQAFCFRNMHPKLIMHLSTFYIKDVKHMSVFLHSFWEQNTVRKTNWTGTIPPVW